MRCLGGIIFILSLSFSLSLSDLLAGEIYIWKDTDGVVNITNDPRELPPGGEAETVHYRENDFGGGQFRSDQAQPNDDRGETETIQTREQLPETELNRKAWEKKLEQTREEYEQLKKLVEKRRRQDVRQSSKRSRDAYKDALQELAEKREQLRMLQRGQ